jgi:hypothetical protein
MKPAYEKAILWVATEDYAPLAEVASELMGMGIGEEQARQEALDTTRQLVQKGALRVGVRRGDDVKFVPSDEGLKLLEDLANWHFVAHAGETVCVDITDVGKARYTALVETQDK